MKFLNKFIYFFLVTNILAIYTIHAKTMYYLKFKATTQEERNTIANYVHPDVIIGQDIYSVVNEDDFKSIMREIPHLVQNSQKTKIDDESSIKNNDYEFPSKDEDYHTYEEMVSKLDKLAKKFPNITQRFQIGKSVEGRNLEVIRISKSLKLNTVPGIIFVGTHHAREHLSTEIPLMAIEYLLENYGKDLAITNLIDNRDIYFVPVVNPDGMLYDIMGRKYKMWRKNRRDNEDGRFGVDLNRNYSFGWGTGGSSTSTGSDVYMGPKPFSEPETLAIKNFVSSKTNVRIVTSFHTFSELILYPWGGKNEGIGGVDQQVHEKMAQTMSKWNGYKPMQASGLYIASGDTCDWAYGELGMFCFTFELTPKSQWSGGFYPGAGVIQSTFQANIKPILYLIENSADPYSVIKSEHRKYNF